MLTLKSLGRGSRVAHGHHGGRGDDDFDVEFRRAQGWGRARDDAEVQAAPKSAKTIPLTVKTTPQIAKSIPHTPALLKAVRRIEIKKAQEYRCTKARRWLRYQKGLRTRYAKRLTELGTWEKQAVAAHDTRKAAGLNTDITRVKATSSPECPSRTHAEVLRQDPTGRCEVRSEDAPKRRTNRPRRR